MTLSTLVPYCLKIGTDEKLHKEGWIDLKDNHLLFGELHKDDKFILEIGLVIKLGMKG